MKLGKKNIRRILHKLEDLRELLDNAGPLCGPKQRAVENAYDISLDVTDIIIMEQR